MFSIYKVTNTRSNKIYVGLSKDPKKRWNRHMKTAAGNGKKQRFHEALAKYGSDAFTFEVIEMGIENRELANIREKFWIAEFRSFEREHGYNGTPGGDGGPTFLGRKHTDEWKRRMSEVQSNRSPEWRENFKKAHQNRSPEWCRNLSIAQQNREPASLVTRERLREAWVKRKAEGRIISEEGRRKISEKHRGKTCPQQTKDGVSDARKLQLLQQDVAVFEGVQVLAAGALRRYRTRMNERFWKSFVFKSPAVEELSRDLRSRLQYKDSCPEESN